MENDQSSYRCDVLGMKVAVNEETGEHGLYFSMGTLKYGEKTHLILTLNEAQLVLDKIQRSIELAKSEYQLSQEE